MALAAAPLKHSTSTYTRVHNGVPLQITQLVSTRGNTVQQIQTTVSGANGLYAVQVYTGYNTMDQVWHTVYGGGLLLNWPVLANNGYTTARATASANHHQYLQFALGQIAKSVQAQYGGS